LEKNTDAQRFYSKHGFVKTGERKLEEGTDEYTIEMKRYGR
jgi:putative acetyltransferase